MSKFISSIAYNNQPVRCHINFHSKYKIIFVTKGSANITLNNNTFLLSQYDMLLLSDCDYYSIQSSHLPFQRYILVLSTQAFWDSFSDDNILSLFKLRPQKQNSYVRIENPTEVTKLFENIICEYHDNRTYSDTLIGMYLHEILISAYRSTAGTSYYLNQSIVERILYAQKLLEINYNTDIKICEICDDLNISRYYFTHQFTILVGCSPKQYLTNIRLNHARKLLLKSSLTIAEIAEKVGFANQNNFIRCFKNVLNTTPGYFRHNPTAII